MFFDECEGAAALQFRYNNTKRLLILLLFLTLLLLLLLSNKVLKHTIFWRIYFKIILNIVTIEMYLS